MISFYTQDSVQEPRLRKSALRAWLKAVAQEHGKRIGNLCYLFCDDAYILEANRQYLGHDYYTDIITFDTSEGDRISGDLLISLDTVETNAELVGVSYAEELHRVIIHGVLHLCGYGDKTPEEEQRMRQLEDDALETLKQLLVNKSLLK